jgi:hypothetical protein
VEVFGLAWGLYGPSRRSDAEAHLQAMRRLVPSATYLIVFDVQIEPQNSMLEQK